MTIGVTVLGSTGSVGINTLDVISRHPDKYHVSALSAFSSVDILFDQCAQFHPEKVVMVEPDSAEKLRSRFIKTGLQIEVGCEEQGVCAIAEEYGETVVCGIVGSAGLMSSISAIKAGKKVLIANKEPLVMLGSYFLDLARKSGACLLPLDSEHNAIFQCLPQRGITNMIGSPTMSGDLGIKKIMLTGSGGPFRTLPLEQMHLVTPAQACAHPNWKMGRKISVDSATMMNKGLELIEACILFGVQPEMVEIVIHPQSIIHSMVEYIDGSVLAQMASPDMRVPIASALAWPDRIESGARQLNLRENSHFDFELPDEDRFPALQLAQEAAHKGGTLPAIMNAANEIAVAAFLEGKIGFDKITASVASVMASVASEDAKDLESVLLADKQARAICNDIVAAHAGL